MFTEHFSCQLYLVLGTKDCKHHGIEALIAQALAGGVDCVQLREKELDDASYLALARKVAPQIKAANALFLLNDRPHLIKESQADGCHLGQGDMPLDQARALYGRDAIFGLSVGSLAERQASGVDQQGFSADYVAIGPAFATESKSDAGAALGIKGLKSIAKGINKPLVAIGGITIQNARQIYDAGFGSIAVISAIAGQKDPQQAAHALKSAMF